MGNTCLIVGASGEIGTAIAKKLAGQGCQLILHYHQNEASIRNLINEINADQIIKLIRADLSKQEGLQFFLSQLHMDINKVVFASGTSTIGLIQDLSNEDMDRLLHLHVKALWRITQHVLPGMITLKTGHIVLITSIWGEVGASCEVAYSTVKGAQNTFVRALAKETGPSGIHVNGVSPGFIDTKMNHHLSEMEKLELVSDIPLQKSGQPEDVADAVSFLLSDRAKYITGEILRVNGGWS
ncbi:3-oxoacyl-[acyl-carrier protein] reductase [Gracilibacillus ureilyticus]|uniref:3-oxoacyl-[acyl-carrier protein] reductase n=1 Tax=Gracilibacillus ureilyticus TaxID=531814 RepID=A0A1H9LA76_9BACI|nr:SDR family oxidoreductase [Gracilibacillus ureilyticus]SER08097.1 3-oxoacyl-[acyl-carrier protein] reductase [Gracilibacillus ureilyticus]